MVVMVDGGGRNDRRKARTRAQIITAANTLFHERGYAATSMEQIAIAADVAPRTIYLHFESKAAVIMAYFDDWLAEFVRLVALRELGEGVDDAVERALATMRADGWDDDNHIEDVAVLPPGVAFIGDDNPEIAGHMLHRWVAAQDELTERFRAATGAMPDAVEPRLEATAVFSAWLATLLDFRERFRTAREGDSTHEVGVAAIRAFARGIRPE